MRSVCGLGAWNGEGHRGSGGPRDSHFQGPGELAISFPKHLDKARALNCHLPGSSLPVCARVCGVRVCECV